MTFAINSKKSCKFEKTDIQLRKDCEKKYPMHIV